MSPESEFDTPGSDLDGLMAICRVLDASGWTEEDDTLHDHASHMRVTVRDPQNRSYEMTVSRVT